LKASIIAARAFSLVEPLYPRNNNKFKKKKANIQLNS